MSGIRISGLASGLDTESIIKDMMRAQRLPVDKLKQQRQTLEWQRDSYREVNLLLTNFRDSTLNMRLQSTFMTKNTSASNESKVTATAAATAGDVSYTISKISQLATSATNSSASGISTDPNNKISTTDKLYSIQDKFQAGAFEWKDTGTGIKEDISVDSAGKEFTLRKLGKESIESVTGINVSGTAFTVVEKLEDLDESQNQVFVDANTGKMTFSKELEADSTITAEYKSIFKDSVTVSEKSNEATLTHVGITDIKGDAVTVKWYENSIERTETFTLNNSGSALAENEFSIDKETGKMTFGKDLEKGATVEASYHHKYFEFEMVTHASKGEAVELFKFDGKDNLNSVINAMNESDLGINVFYDEFSDKITMSRTESGNYNTTGNGKEIGFRNSSFLKVGLQMDQTNEVGGANAKFTLNGLETERNSNTFTFNGVTFTLKDKIDPAAGDVPVTISVTNDTTKALDNIKEFVNSYNELIDKIQGKLKEERYKDYTPLTDEQREALSDKEIEKWEEKSKSGMLRNDQNLRSLLDKLRMDFYTPLANSDSEFKQLSAIGITTTANYLEGGKLQINEAKLKEALEKDPEGIYNLFAADGTASGEKGISRRLRDSLTSSISTITERAGSGTKTNSQFTIGKNLDSINTRIKDMEARLVEKEDRYWKQFSAMETAMQKMNEQMNYLMSQLGGTAG
ncbi:flagellar filament capping protein FliD [Cytobacillus sp.]|uniref:flagellar filament capping protein FliD n=1 Tax=Cytobacillus sp. TaxID=2675269 RepID=UPI003518123F